MSVPQVVYEVNLQVDTEAAEAFMKWLGPHVEEMLTFDGFQSATIHTLDPKDVTPAPEASKRQLVTVCYT